MSLPIYLHADGGHYVIVESHAFSMKMDDGRWSPAILYRRVHLGPTDQWQYEGPNQFATTKERWSERFVLTDITTARTLREGKTMQGNEQSQDVGNLGTRADTITFTVDQAQALEAAYNAAIEAGEPQFTFEGREYLVDYARHLLMYLGTEFHRRGLWPDLGVQA